MARHSVHIEHKAYDPEGASGQLRDVLRDHVGREIRVADAATLSGIPLYNIEPALLALTSEYPSRIRVDEEGELIFTFDSLDDPREGGDLEQALRRLGRAVGRLFVPVVVFVTLVLSCPLLMTLGANHFAMMAVAGGLLGVLGAPFFLSGFFTASGGFVWGTIMLLMLMPTLFFGLGLALLALLVLEPDAWFVALLFGIPMTWFGGKYAYAQLTELPAALRSQEKGTIAFWRSTAGFIFGPVPSIPDRLEDERRLTAFIRAQEGVLSRGDLMALFGWDEVTADRELTRILVDYSGDVAVTEEGVLLYRFPTLASSAPIGDEEAHDLRPIWEHTSDPPRLFDCPTGLWIFLLFLLIFGALGLILHPDLVFFPDAADYRRLSRIEIQENMPMWFLEGAGGFIYVPVLGLPLLRLPFWGYATWRHRQRQDALRRLSTQVASREEEAAAAERARRLGWDAVGESV